MTSLRGPTLRFFLKGYLLVGVTAIAAAIGLYTLWIADEIERQAELTTRLIASLAGPTLFAQNPDLTSQQQLRQVIGEVDFPFVFTDREGRPIIWNARKLGVPLPERYEDILSMDLENPRDAEVRVLLRRIDEFDRENEPIPLYAPGGETVSGYMHYGSSSLSQRLLWMPWLEAGLILAFMGVVLVAFRNMKRSEQRNIWVGMAKETAHQLGTPLTSLSGWLTLLGDQRALDQVERAGQLDRGQLMSEIQRDVERLSKVSARFSQIGSRPKLVLGRVDQLVAQVCSYFRSRLPHLGKQVTIVERIEEVPLAPVNEDLLDWAVENLVKNALDAIDKEQGVVEIGCRYVSDSDRIEILVTDNGKGMPLSVQKRVFQPGFSTKQRGWGMGLVLVQRIVVEYHRGQVDVLRSVEGAGSTLRIRLVPR